jgi:hypothetical protein
MPAHAGIHDVLLPATPADPHRQGSSGHSCFGYRPRISFLAATQPPRQNPAKSPVTAIGRPAGDNSEICSFTRPPANTGV